MIERRTRLPPLNALRAFDASARYLNFRLAAEELGVTQGAVAQHVRGLEADLGIKLFDRLPRALALTSQGRRYAGHLRRAFELMAEATGELRPEPLRLTISVTPSFASKWLVARLPAFTEMHPTIELQILATESLANFQSDGVDIAVRNGRPPFGPGLVADLLFEQEVVAVGSPTLLRQRKLGPGDICQFTLLHDAHDLWPEFFDRVLERAMPNHTRRVRFSQTSLAIDAAISGQGIAVASQFLVLDDIAAGRLLPAVEATMRGAMDAYVVTTRRPRLPEPTAIVRHWLLEGSHRHPSISQ